MKKIYIVILNYNGEKDTKECLDSLLTINKKGFSVNTLLVDNNSDKKISIEEKDYKDLNLEIINNSKNLGFSGGNNVGIRKALKGGADYVLLLNNDTLVEQDFLLKLFSFSEENKKVGIAVPKIYFAKGYEFHKDRYKKEDLGKVIWYAGGIIDWRNIIGHHIGVDEVDNGRDDNVSETDFASGCCMIIRKEVFEKIGFLDERYFLYYEDSDYSIRAKKAGFNIYFVPTAVIWHKNAGSTGGSGSDLQDYYITRNRLLFGLQYGPIKSKTALLREGLRLLINGRPMQKKGARDFFLRKFYQGNVFNESN